MILVGLWVHILRDGSSLSWIVVATSAAQQRETRLDMRIAWIQLGGSGVGVEGVIGLIIA